MITVNDDMVNVLINKLHASKADSYFGQVQEALAAALSSALSSEAVRCEVLTEGVVKQAMHEAWNDICYDTGCHPLDIQQLGRRRLQFAPHHWASATYDRIRALQPTQPEPAVKVDEWQPTHRHVKRGTEYQLIGIGKMQAESWIDLNNDNEHKVDMREVAVYRGDDGLLWVRPIEEFNDGRFAPLNRIGGAE